MQGAGWKLTALAASLAIGFVVLMQVQKSLDPTEVSHQAVDEEPNGEKDPSTSVKDGQADRLADELALAESVRQQLAPAGQPEKKNLSAPAKKLQDQNQAAFKPDPFKPDPFKSAPAKNNKPEVTNPFANIKQSPPVENRPLLNPPGMAKPLQTASKSKPPLDPFAAFAPEAAAQVDQAKKQLNNFAEKANGTINKNVVKLEQELDQWSSGVTNASHDAKEKVEEKVKQVAGLFPESAPLNNAVHETVVPAAGEKKSPSEELIELTQNLTPKFPDASRSFPAAKKPASTSGFPALSPPQAPEKESVKQARPQFPAPELQKTPLKAPSEEKIVITPGAFPAPEFDSSKPVQPAEPEIKKVAEFAPTKRPAFPAPEATVPEKAPQAETGTSKKKPFFEGFPEATDTPAGKADDPYRSVPEFNSEKPIREMNREPAPVKFDSGKENAPVAAPGAFPESSPAVTEPVKPAPEAPALTPPSYNPGLPPATEEKMTPLPGGFPSTPSETPAAPAEPAQDLDPELIGSARVDVKDSERVLQPKVELYKSAPEKAVLGQPLIYTIEIENTGDVAVKEVKVEDKFPAGTKLTGTIPRAELVNKTLFWTFDELAPGERRKILVRVVPIEAGNIGSVSTVSYKSVVKAQTLITAPKLELILTASEQVAIGETAQLHFVARNTGDGDAHDVVLQNLIPAGFEHPAGTDLEYDIGTLKPGEKKEITLQLNAKKPGIYQNVASIKTGGGLKVEAKASLEVIPAVMSLSRKSPSRRFVGHAMQQSTTVRNNSHKLLKNVTIIEYVPAGFRFKKASDNGLYSEELRTITWTTPQLASGKEMQITSTLIPTNIGTQTMKVKALDASGHLAELTSDVKVEGFSSLAVRVPDARGPVSRGERVSIRFKVVNRGSAQATRVRVSCKIPAQLEYVSANGPVKSMQNGELISFLPIASLGANQEAAFDLVFSAKDMGDARVEFEVSSDQATIPLKHHEQVVIYGE